MRDLSSYHVIQLVVKIEPRIEVKFCAKLGRSASEKGAVLSEAHAAEAVKKFSVINC
jgi:hypothetical protein